VKNDVLILLLAKEAELSLVPTSEWKPAEEGVSG